jgi:uncharacterized coiled-coil protein SlyX
MDDQEIARRITSLEARMNRMETMMQELLSTLTSSRADFERTKQMETLLQELFIREGIHTRGTTGINPVAVPPQDRPEIPGIREALLAGDKMKAIKLYRSAYGVSLKEALDALDAML